MRCLDTTLSSPRFRLGILITTTALAAVLLGALWPLMYQHLAMKWLVACAMGLAFAVAFLATGHPRMFLICTTVFLMPFKLDVLIYRDDIVLTTTDVCMMLLAFFWLLDISSHKCDRVAVTWIHILPLVALLCASTLSMIGSISKADVAGQMSQYFRLAAMAFIVANNIRDSSELRIVLYALMGALCFAAVSSIIEKQTGFAFNAMGAVRSVEPQGETSRVGGVFVSPNASAMFLAPLLMMNITALVYLNSKLVAKLALGLSLCAGFAALVFTYSRAGLLSFACGLACLLLLLATNRKVSLVKLVLILLLVALVSFPMYAVFERRQSEDPENVAAMSRIPLMKQAWLIISRNPVFGVGGRNYTFAMWRNPLGSSAFWHFNVHNAYLLVFAECGIGGILSLLWFLGAFASRARSCLRFDDDICRTIGTGAFCFMVVMCVHMHLDLWYPSSTQVLIFCMILAMMVAAQRINSTSEVNATSSRGGTIRNLGCVRDGLRPAIIARRRQCSTLEL